MDPITGSLIAGGVGALVQGGLGLIGDAMAAGDREKARKLYEDLLKQIQSIPEPELREQAAVLLGESELGKVKADPSLVAAQRAALAKLQQISDEGGLTLEDKAVLETQLSRAARADAAGRNAISNQMQARGTLGSGAELAMALQGQQSSAQRGYESARDTAAQAQRRAYEAIMGRGSLAGQMRGQDFNEQSTAAKARDEIARYNAAAQERANAYNAGLSSELYKARLAKAQTAGGATSALANQYMGEAQGKANQMAGYGAAASRAIEGANDAYWDWEKEKLKAGK